MSDTSASTSTPNKKLPQAGSVGCAPSRTCQHCKSAATVSVIDEDGVRSDLCAAHNRSCGACQCYAPVADSRDGRGECRRSPPRLLMIGGDLQTAYPDVDPRTGWCVDGFRAKVT